MALIRCLIYYHHWFLFRYKVFLKQKFLIISIILFQNVIQINLMSYLLLLGCRQRIHHQTLPFLGYLFICWDLLFCLNICLYVARSVRFHFTIPLHKITIFSRSCLTIVIITIVVVYINLVLLIRLFKCIISICV